jgi:DNA polymerase elongation subunit (family B)
MPPRSSSRTGEHFTHEPFVGAHAPLPCSESARVFGVDFRSVRTRGSQFKVESVMLKIAKPENFLLLSPNRAEVSFSMR